MDPARAAGMSWPDMNYQFSRQWTPPKRKRPSVGALDRRDFVFGSDPTITALHRTAQHTFDDASRRAAAIDRAADALLHLGYPAQAERLSHVAAEIRGEAV